MFPAAKMHLVFLSNNKVEGPRFDLIFYSCSKYNSQNWRAAKSVITQFYSLCTVY